MGQNKYKKYIVCILVIINLASNYVLSDIHRRNPLGSDNSIYLDQITNPNDLYEIYSVENPEIFPENPQLYYTPIDTQTGVGDNFSIRDELSVSHINNLILNSSNDWEESFNIQPPSDFSADYLQYDMTITSIQDSYAVYDGAVENKHARLDSGSIRVAQAFQIIWDYGVFYSAEINLVTTGPTLGNDEIELYVVKANGLGEPNLSDIRAVEVNGPYNSSNLIPPSSVGNYGYYDFLNTSKTGEAILEKGTYFIVIELTVVDDNNDEFDWLGKQIVTPGYPCYDHDGVSWNEISDETRGLLVELKHSYSNGTAQIITDPSNIVLEDNSVSVTSLTQQIIGSGIHTLISNDSVEITMNNTYIFDKAVLAKSNYVVSNSTHLAETVYWTLVWDISILNLLNYTNPARTQELLTPSDWNNQTFNLLVNDSISISGVKSTLGYNFNLNTILSGIEYASGNLTFTSTSSNYLYDLNLNTHIFNLGSWTTDGTYATGTNGSLVIADVFIKDLLSSDVLSGELNFTLYDPNGDIVPLKTDVPSNIIFNDVTEYTILQLSQEFPGQYSINTVFDPSIDGSDSEGFWTVVCYWKNGTEIGFYSERISVRKSTTASFSWEETVGGSMISNSSIIIERINLQGIIAQIQYNNISDPFFTGEGTPIISAPVAYNTSWGTSGLLNYVGPYYELDIPINVLSGDYSITLTATGLLLETHSITFNLKVYHTFEISPNSYNYNSYYNDAESIIPFTVEDLSNETDNPIIPDEMYFYLDDVLLVETLEYGVREFSGTNDMQLELYSNSLGLDLVVGSYTIRISVSKLGFFVDYEQENATTQVTLNIQETPTLIEIISSEDELYYGNETTIAFIYVDTIHSQNISGAEFDVSFDVQDAELITKYENDGTYYIVFRIHEPQETTVNVFINISKDGYVSQIDIAIKSISILNPVEGEIPPILFVVIGIFGAAIIITPMVYFIRRKMNKDKRAEKTLFTRIYGLYESVLSITKIIIVHKVTGLPVYEMDLGSEITLDPSLITGFLSAISSMGVELRGDKAGSVKRLQYKNFLVTGTESGQFTIYTFSEADLNEEIEERLTVISNWFAKMFNQIPEDWDGSTEIFRINLQGITEKIMTEIHLWIFYPFIISPYKTNIIAELTGLKKQLITYIMENDHVTISKIFDEIDSIRIEIGLPIIFEFIELGILTPVFDAYKIATVRF